MIPEPTTKKDLMHCEVEVLVVFSDGTVFEGFLGLNPFSKRLVLDNDEGQFDANEYEIQSILFLP